MHAFEGDPKVSVTYEPDLSNLRLARAENSPQQFPDQWAALSHAWSTFAILRQHSVNGAHHVQGSRCTSPSSSKL